MRHIPVQPVQRFAHPFSFQAGGSHFVGCGWSSGSTNPIAASSTVPATVSALASGTLISVVVTTRGGPGSCTIGIRKSTYSGFPGSLADITGGTPVTLTSVDKYSDTTMTSYTIDVTAGDVYEFDLLTCTGFTQITIQLFYD